MQSAFNSEFLDYLENRRSVTVNFLKSPGPDAGELDKMLTIASRVPDHGKLSPWRFIVYHADKASAIGDFFAARCKERNPNIEEGALDVERNRFAQAPLAIGVLSSPNMEAKVPLWEQQLTAGLACYNLLLAANAHGFGAQWLTAWYASDEKAAAFLGARDGEQFAGFIFIGTPELTLQDRDRPDVAELTSVWSG